MTGSVAAQVLLAGASAASAGAACYVLCGRARGAGPASGAGGGASRLLTALEGLGFVELARRRETQAAASRECAEQMPVMIDVVVLGLTAGLSFDASLELYCERYDDALSRALAHAMLSWRIGAATREEALQEAAASLDAPALARFASVACESIAFGSPLAGPLERQAQVIREEQRSRVEEEIERVPVKMLIPLGTLIVPAMLLAILGPLLGSALTLG